MGVFGKKNKSANSDKPEKIITATTPASSGASSGSGGNSNISLVSPANQYRESNIDLDAEGRLQARDHVTAIIDKGAAFEGRLTFEGAVQIGGEFKGEIFTQGTLIIGEEAFVSAQIEADTIIINGRVEGNLFARRRVIMHPPATFKGTVTTPSLRIDEGVVFEGASYMPKSDQH